MDVHEVRGGSVDDFVSSFKLQIAVWGYAVEGTGDRVTRIIEKDWQPTIPMWDDTTVLKNAALNGATPPQYFALPWVCEDIRRERDRNLPRTP